ncbi:MAG: hypothetical protein WCD18_04380 [Thermosynechococcaceae cyanobacterium]
MGDCAQDQDALQGRLALPPTAILALHTLHLPMSPDPDALDDVAPVLALCPDGVPMTFSSFIPNDSVRSWLTAALPLVLAPWVNEAEAVAVKSDSRPSGSLSY